MYVKIVGPKGRDGKANARTAEPGTPLLKKSKRPNQKPEAGPWALMTQNQSLPNRSP